MNKSHLGTFFKKELSLFLLLIRHALNAKMGELFQQIARDADLRNCFTETLREHGGQQSPMVTPPRALSGLLFLAAQTTSFYFCGFGVHLKDEHAVSPARGRR